MPHVCLYMCLYMCLCVCVCKGSAGQDYEWKSSANSAFCLETSSWPRISFQEPRLVSRAWPKAQKPLLPIANKYSKTWLRENIKDRVIDLRSKSLKCVFLKK